MTSIHLAEHHTKIATNELRPDYGSPQRDAINSVVDSLVANLCDKIAELRASLDDIEQRILESAAHTKHSLQGHILVCIRFNDEIAHIKNAIEGIKEAS